MVDERVFKEVLRGIRYRQRERERERERSAFPYNSPLKKINLVVSNLFIRIQSFFP